MAVEKAAAGKIVITILFPKFRYAVLSQTNNGTRILNRIYTSYLLAYEDGTDSMFRNVGI
jgi:hypothetical protein